MPKGRLIASIILLIACASPVYGRNLFDSVRYKQATLSSGTQVLYDSLTNKVAFMWLVPSQLGENSEKYPASSTTKPFWCPLDGAEAERLTREYLKENKVR